MSLTHDSFSLVMCFSFSAVVKSTHACICVFLQGTEETVRVVSMDKDFHVDCYICEVRA